MAWSAQEKGHRNQRGTSHLRQAVQAPQAHPRGCAVFDLRFVRSAAIAAPLSRAGRSTPIPASWPGSPPRFARWRLAVAPGEELDWAIEPMAVRAADFCSFKHAAGGMQEVPFLHLSRKPAPSPAAVIQVCGTVQEDHIENAHLHNPGQGISGDGSRTATSQPEPRGWLVNRTPPSPRCGGYTIADVGTMSSSRTMSAVLRPVTSGHARSNCR